MKALGEFMPQQDSLLFVLTISQPEGKIHNGQNRRSIYRSPRRTNRRPPRQLRSLALRSTQRRMTLRARSKPPWARELVTGQAEKAKGVKGADSSAL